jgi:hypothetical protein
MPPGSASEIDYRSVLVTIDGKLRGSRARFLAAAVEDLHGRGYDQLVIDLRRCGSLDSLGVAALERALELGHRLFVIAGAALPLDDFLPVGLAAHARLRIYRSAEDAFRAVRSRDQSGVLVA